MLTVASTSALVSASKHALFPLLLVSSSAYIVYYNYNIRLCVNETGTMTLLMMMMMMMMMMMLLMRMMVRSTESRSRIGSRIVVTFVSGSIATAVLLSTSPLPRPERRNKAVMVEPSVAEHRPS